MAEIAANQIKGYQSPVHSAGFPAAKQQTPPSYVAVSTPAGRRIYEYPQASIYNEPGKKSASGLNIYVFNPAGAGAPNTINNNFPAGMNASSAAAPIGAAAAPIANTSIMQKESAGESDKSKNKKKKPAVALTNDYLHTLESFLRSRDKTVRKQGIRDLIRRFEEDETRYNNKSLTECLNIALQDYDKHNRLLALSPLASGSAHGNEKTKELLKEMTKSDALYGQIAKSASEALLKASHTRKES